MSAFPRSVHENPAESWSQTWPVEHSTKLWGSTENRLPKQGFPAHGMKIETQEINFCITKIHIEA